MEDSLLNCELDCKTGDWYVGLLGRRLGPTAEEIRLHGLTSEAARLAWQLWRRHKGFDIVAYNLRTWLYRRLFELEATWYGHVYLNGRPLTVDYFLRRKPEELPDWTGCPVCGQWYLGYRVCCGRDTVLNPETSTNPWAVDLGLAPWEILAARHPMGIQDGF